MTFKLEYRDEPELKRKLSSIILSLEVWQTYEEARERFGYGKHESNTFSMRLLRFQRGGGTFPKQMHAAGRKLKLLKVTPALAEHLAR